MITRRRKRQIIELMLTNSSGQVTKRWSWQLFYWSGLALILAWAAWQRFTLPLDPIADPDTWGYLSPALRKLSGAEFGHTYGRNFIYPGFVFLVLRFSGDFRAITMAQHFLGLSAGILLLFAWRRTRVFVPNPQIGRAGHDALGLSATAIFLLAKETMRFETQLRPEGVCAFLIGLNLYVIIQFIAGCFLERRRMATVGYGIASAFTAILLASTKPSFGFVAILSMLPVGIFLFQRGWLAQKIVLGCGALASAAMLLCPEHFLSRTDEGSRTFLPTTLFVVHADLIRDQMAEDLERAAKVPYPREWLERIQATLSAEIAKSSVARPGHYASLGFDPDYLMYAENSIAAQLRQEFENNVSALCTFYRFYYGRIWRHRPLLVMKKIARQMSIFYAPMCPAYIRGRYWPLSDDYKSGVMALDIPPYRPIWTACPAAVDYMNRTQSLARNAPVRQQPFLIRKMLSLLASSHMLLLFSTLGLSVYIFWQKSLRQHLAWLAGLVFFVYLYNVAGCLEVAIVNSLEVRRYLTVQMVFTLFAHFLALWLVIEFVQEKRAHHST
jgi:hypothetical protein